MKNTTSLVQVLSLSVALLLTLVASSSQAQASRARPADLISVSGGVNLGALESQASIAADIDVRYYREGRHGVALRFTGGTENIGEARYSLRFGTSENPSQNFGFSANIDAGLGGGTHEHYESGLSILGGAIQRSENYLLLYGVAATTGTMHLGPFHLGLEFGVRLGATDRLRSDGGRRLMKDGFAEVFASLRLGFSFDV